MNYIHFVFTVFCCSLSMTSVRGNRQAEWVLIGGRNYDFNPGQLNQNDAKARCIRMGGKLFEPKDKKTNRDVFVQAGALLGQAGTTNRDLWIGVSDLGTELQFTYLSTETPMEFICDGSAGNTAGCWQTAPTADAGGVAVDCVTGSSANDGKWTNNACTGTNRGSICEQATAPITTTQATTTTTASYSTCLKSGITVMIGMLFFCYQ